MGKAGVSITSCRQCGEGGRAQLSSNSGWIHQISHLGKVSFHEGPWGVLPALGSGVWVGRRAGHGPAAAQLHDLPVAKGGSFLLRCQAPRKDIPWAGRYRLLQPTTAGRQRGPPAQDLVLPQLCCWPPGRLQQGTSLLWLPLDRGLGGGRSR